MKYSETGAGLCIAECKNKYRKQKLYVHFIASYFRFRAGLPGSCSNLQYLQQFPAELADIPEQLDCSLMETVKTDCGVVSWTCTWQVHSPNSWWVFSKCS